MGRIVERLSHRPVLRIIGSRVSKLVLQVQSTTKKYMPGLRETFTKGHTVERTNKAEVRPEEECEEGRGVGRIYGTKYSSKGHKDRNRHTNRITRSGQARLVYVKDIN